jgi:hypothetical protein
MLSEVAWRFENLVDSDEPKGRWNPAPEFKRSRGRIILPAAANGVGRALVLSMSGLAAYLIALG